MSKITSIKHKEEKRAHIPSKEEAGMEDANESVKQNGQATYPINPVVHRGQDPELFWKEKYGNDDREQLLKVDIRSLYRHEHISPELLINNLYKIKEGQSTQLDMYSLFGNNLKMDELDKVADYYKLDKSLIIPSKSTDIKQPAIRPPITGFIIDKAKRDLGYNPHSFEEGIKILEDQMKEMGK